MKFLFFNMTRVHNHRLRSHHWWKVPPLEKQEKQNLAILQVKPCKITTWFQILCEFTQFQGAQRCKLCVYLVLYKQSTFVVGYKRALLCSSAVAATCGALSMTSPVAQKLLGAPFGLVLECAGKPLQIVEMQGTAW